MNHHALLVALVASPSLLAAQRALDLTGTPAAAIEQSFTKISGVQELSPTLAVATDNMEAKVLLVDFARNTVKQLGTKGRGPNEYQYPSPPIMGPGGAYVFDTYQKRAIVVDAKGAIAGMRAMPDANSLSRVKGSDRGHNFYFEGSDFDPTTGRFSDSLPVMRWDPASNRIQPVTRVHGGGRVIIQRGGSAASLAREITPFPHLNAWVPLPDGRIAIVRSDTFRIEFVTPAGTKTFGPALLNKPIAISASERQWYRDTHTPPRMGAALAGGGTGPQSMAPQWEDATFPAVMPPFIGSDVLATPEGEIWIGRSFSSADRTRKYEIYDGSGKLVGVATLKPNARVVGFGPKSVYVARTNADDDLVYLDKYHR